MIGYRTSYTTLCTYIHFTLHACTHKHTHTQLMHTQIVTTVPQYDKQTVYGEACVGMCRHVHVYVCVKVHRQIDRRVCAHCITHLDVCWFFELVKLFLESLSGRLGLLWTQHKTTKDLTHCKVEVSSDGGSEGRRVVRRKGDGGSEGRRVVRRKGDGGSEGRRGEEGWWYWEISVLDTVTTGR